MGLIQRLFGGERSGQTAKNRLQIVLMHDRADISPQLMMDLKRDLLAVIMRYLEVDETRTDMQLEHEEGSVALVANIPVTTVRRMRAKARSSEMPAGG